jgi:hypothetical protein
VETLHKLVEPLHKLVEILHKLVEPPHRSRPMTNEQWKILVESR